MQNGKGEVFKSSCILFFPLPMDKEYSDLQQTSFKKFVHFEFQKVWSASDVGSMKSGIKFHKVKSLVIWWKCAYG